ncbi:gliding motility-associated C-terminal domain-containing protein [Flavobacteriaceae bacterium MAR_2010_188]|nr:gliding motility-associated C-terminal domain-containing protein [Flavobacteriaceae bacterium MAR_2010_188]
MTKPTFLQYGILTLLLLLGFQLFAQTYKPFTPRENLNVRGSMLVIGNSILGKDNQDFNDLSKDNQDISMQYIDIDGDASTFSSSSANLLLQPQEDGSPTTCYRVAYAGLYWGAVLQSGDRSDINKVKFKLPGSSVYTNITGEIVYDAIGNPIVSENNEPGNTPYACYAEVTDMLAGLSGVEGTYTLANVTSSLGFNNSTGLSAGWSLVVIYEDPNLHAKSFTTYDGFSHIYDDHYEQVQVTGFTTPPAGPIDLQFAYGTLDGDRTKRATKLEINRKEVTTPFRSANKFFGSVIENYNGISHPRNPFSTNTLGYDTGFLEIKNSDPEYIKNNVSEASFTLQVARGQADPIFVFFTAFAVDIIAPDIDLTKIVLDENGNNIDGDEVIMGQRVFYEIKYQSVGNDNVTQFTIKDILPENIIFDPATDIDLSNAGGATLQSYDPATRTIIFSIPDASVEINDPSFVIRLAVRVVPNCYDLTTACSNEIKNQAFATYRGVLDPTIIEEEGSFATVECLGIPAPTNFLVNLSNCNFEKTEVLCGNSVLLKAADGYDTYSWSSSPSGPVISTDQTYTATETGTYYVTNTINSNCITIEEVFNVITYGTNLTNPIIPFADLLPICPNDGKVLPYIFLCGANDERSITTGISDAVSIIWEKLDESSCAAVTIDDCANEDDACTWNQIATGPNYTANISGQFRIVINYPGGCYSIFYFNVYQNLLQPTITAKDILCTTPGQVTVGGVPSGYEYSLEPNGPYQSSNIFPVSNPGYYKVYIRQLGVVTNPCIFQTPEVYVRQRDFTVNSTVIQPSCFGDKGTIILAANDALPQYYFSIYDGATLVNSVGPLQASDYTFENLNPGSYTVNVSTDDGCFYTEDIAIIDQPLLSVTAALTVPLTCTEGEITIYPEGGTAPYTYFINSTTVSQDIPTYIVESPGVYNITVYDYNSCSATTSITVEEIKRPEYNVTHTDLSCSDSNDGNITINVTNANGNAIMYSIDNGVSFFDSPVFSGIGAGAYEVVVQYTSGAQPCITTPTSVTINAPDPITATVTLTNPYSCISDATITVTNVSGGTAPYQYSLDGVNFQTGNSFSGLTPGSYQVTVKDANNCTYNAGTIVIDPLQPPTDLSFSQSPVTCPSNTASITIDSVTGGVSPFEYQIIAPASATTTYQTSNVFAGLAPGTYTFQVKDANDCTYIESYTIEPLPPLTVDVVLTKDLDCTTSTDAVITGNISGSFPPFVVSLIQGGGTPSITGNTFTLSTSISGNYEFQITDDRGCIIQSRIITVSDVIVVTVDVDKTDPSCDGNSNGSIKLNPLTGQAPFTYSIDGGINFVTTNVFGGLAAGTYNYVVQDNNGCSVSAAVDLEDPLPLDITIISNPIQCNPNVPGSIDVSINSGGVAPFTYTLYDNDFTQIDSNVGSNSTTHTFSGLDFQDYFVSVIDSKGCEFNSEGIRIESPPNIVLTGNSSSGTCVGGAIVDIDVITGVGPYTYSIYGQPTTAFGPTNLTTHQFTGLNHGTTYQFQVIDGGGCYSLIEVTTPSLSPLEINSIITSDVNCFGESDGSVSFTISNYGPMTTTLYYEIQDQLSNTAITPAKNGVILGLTGAPASGTISGLPAGTYTLFVRENDGSLCTVSSPFQIKPPFHPLLSVIAAVENANCNDQAQLTISTTGGTAPYEYAIGAPGFIPVSSDFNNSNVVYLDYFTQTNWDIVTRDANGCEIRINENINIDPEPVIAANLNDACVDADGNFKVEVSVETAGIPPYSYSIDGGAFQTMAAPFTITNLASGTHTFEIRDSNGCGNLVSLDIYSPVNLVSELTALPTCNDDDGEVTLTASGGSGSYTYSISPNPASVILNGNIYSGLPSGTYEIMVTDTVTLCTANVEIVLPEAPALNFTTVPSAVTCFGDDSGSFLLNLLSYSGAYSYEVTDSSNNSVTGVVLTNTSTNPENVSGLFAGTYSVLVKELESPFCTATETVIISSPFEELTLIADETSNVTCDNDRGTIVAIANGGSGGFEYELTGNTTIGYSPSGTFSGLSAGDYTVNAKDSEGCIASTNITLSEPPPIDATVMANTNTLSCSEDRNATITISNVTGGQGSNYTYTLNRISPTVSSSGPQTSPIFSGLGAGTYSVDVTDGYNCIYISTEIIISEPTPIISDLVLETTQSCLTQATLTLSATGGTGTYSYSATANFSNVLGSFSSSITFPVQAGTYTFYVKDANGCVANVSNQISVEEFPPLVVNLDTTNSSINCAGDSTGVIVATAQGGVGDYTYTLQDGSGNAISGVLQENPGVFTGLPVGTYKVNVTSGDCDETSSPVNITEPNSPLLVNFSTTNITCAGNSDGIITIEASGGSGIIKYAISPQLDQFFDDPVFDNLPSGTYQIIVQDQLGCYEIIEATIDEPDPVVITIVPNSVLPEVCDGDNNGEFSITISGGKLPYSVSLDSYDGPYTEGDVNQTEFDFTELGGGDHIVFVRDAAGCESEWNITFPESINFNPVIEVAYLCNNNSLGNTVTVTIEEDVDAADVDYSLDGGPYQSSNVFNNVAAAVGHTISVRHSNGCIQSDLSFDIEDYIPLDMELIEGEINEIVAGVTGGSGTYEYWLNGESQGTKNSFFITASGTYTVLVIDSNGCSIEKSIQMEYIDICIANYFTPNGDGIQDGWAPGCSNQYENLTFKIFDRYGRKVAELNQGEKWDGKYHGKPLPTGDYWYVVDLNFGNDDREFVGHFTLYR